MSKLIEKFKELMASGGIENTEYIEKALPDMEAALDELDVITADGLQWDDADELLGDVLPLILKSVRRQTKGKSLDEIVDVVYNIIIVLKVHYKWDIWGVPEFVERAAIRKIVSIVVRALDKDQKDPDTDSTAIAEDEDVAIEPMDDDEMDLAEEDELDGTEEESDQNEEAE